MIDLVRLAEDGRLPDALVRCGIRRELRERLQREAAGSWEQQLEVLYRFAERIGAEPIAVATSTANEQHYELPAAFFQTFMGPRLKYSSGYWPDPGTTPAEAEEAMLDLTCRRAGLEDGMRILELGCGWGSLSLWMAERYPDAAITAVSNSGVQKAFIDAHARPNLRVITADMNTFATDQRFDRVVSVEMFEHMRNWPRLLQRISHWLKDDGRLFIHIFVHRCLAYLFTKPGTYSWMGEHFFKEGMMPSEALLHVLNRHLFVEHCWRVNGRHYARTLHAWLDQFDRNAAEARTILAGHHGVPDARVFFGRWRMFFMACEELFAYRGGDEWYVAHYLLRKPSPTAIG